MDITSKEALIEWLGQGRSAQYLFFWGHRKPKTGVSNSCFSQWFDAPFAVEGVTYPTAEHFMMAGKARLFGDRAALTRILAAHTPAEAKQLGRQVQGFAPEVWLRHRFDIVVDANLRKFGQNPELQRFLLDTGDRVLVEASPVDAIWGIGLAADDPAADRPQCWPGLNLLGFALMEVRRRLGSSAEARP